MTGLRRVVEDGGKEALRIRRVRQNPNIVAQLFAYVISAVKLSVAMTNEKNPPPAQPVGTEGI